MDNKSDNECQFWRKTTYIIFAIEPISTTYSRRTNKFIFKVVGEQRYEYYLAWQE